MKVCNNHISLLKRYNPNVPIYGLYGGKEEDFPKIKKILRGALKNIYCIRGKSRNWKWKHGDLAIQKWYRAYGRKLDFDVLHLVEWDLLFFSPLDRLYKHVPKNALGLTLLTPLKKVEHTWYWTTHEPHKTEWKQLLNHAREKYGYQKKPYACICGGAYFPRRFLEKYSQLSIPELCHDELRMPLYAQILGFKLCNTGFRRWNSQEDNQYFNAKNIPLKLAAIKKELKKSNGRRAFHPWRIVWND